jgi:small subunit ribosomal protein S2
MATNLKKQKTRSSKPSVSFGGQKGLNTANKRSIGTKKKALRAGDICELKITALAPNNVGIDELTYPYAVFVPNAKYGSTIKAKVLKINKEGLTRNSASFQPSVGAKGGLKAGSYAVAQLLEEIKQAPSDLLNDIPVKPGDTLTVSITKEMTYSKSKGKAGLDELSNRAGIVDLTPKFRLIIPNDPTDRTGSSQTRENVKVIVTRVKSNYGFAKMEVDNRQTKRENETNQTGITTWNLTGNKESQAQKWVYGSKFTTTLPVNSQKYGKYVVLKKNNCILFVKLQKGISLGDKVRIKITSSSNNFAIGKILQVANTAMTQSQKNDLVMNSIRDMINHGMHFGEKAVKCHARMKNYLWLKKQGQNKNRPLIKKGRHVINLLKTRRCLNKALNTLTKYALKGRTFLFIGTKKPAAGLVARASFFTKNSFYVNTRWLGGMLTNWKTICKSISKIRPILKEKQKVVRDILERRQAIKSRLIKKALLLKKKSQLILTKGRALLNLLKNPSARNEMTLAGGRAQKLVTLRNELISKGMEYLQKRQKLIQKRRELIYQTLLLKEKGLEISNKYQTVLNQLAAYTKKLREYKYLLILTSEIQKLKSKNSSGSHRPEVGEVAEQNSLYSVSYGKLKDIQNQNNANYPWIIPNPPKEILNRIVLTMKNQYENDSRTALSGKSTVSQSQNDGSFAGTNQIVICSTLLAKFSRFSPYIKSVIKSLMDSIKSLETQATYYANELNQINKTLLSYVQLKNQFVTELQQLKTKLTMERQVIRIVKRQLKALDAQKKLIKFLPRLRYLPTPQTKISQIVQILLSKIVDPKLKYPIDSIYDQKLSTSSKKLAAARKKKWQRLEKYFGGIANMTKLTKTNISRNVAIIIGQKEEMNAVRECQKLGIKIFTIVDTNCNPTLADHIIPANDDSRNAIKYILTKFITRIRLAQKLRSRLQKLQKIR